MTGGFIAFRCSNYENTAEREQFRLLCNILKDAYKDSGGFCLLIANYNIYDSEFDAILIKNDAIIAIEFKNYGGKIVASENGDWTSDNKIIKGGSRKTVYQQARVNHAALRNGLRELGINADWVKDIPTLVVFNQNIELDNQLSGRVKSWLHIADNEHFIEKIEDITCKSTNMSNSDIIDIVIKMNLSRFIDKSLSAYNDTRQETVEDTSVASIASILTSYNRKTPNHIFALRPNQVFVFGTDTKGSQKYGAAGLAAKKFGAQVGVVDGPTGNCYALPTKGFSFGDLSKAVTRFIQYVENNKDLTFLITPVGCGHAGFNSNEVASLFKNLLSYENVMLPDLFLKVYEHEMKDTLETTVLPEITVKLHEEKLPNTIDRIAEFFSKNNNPQNVIRNYKLSDENGNVVAKAELVITSQKLVFSPYNSQSVAAFKNHGFTLGDPEEFIQSHNI